MNPPLTLAAQRLLLDLDAGGAMAIDEEPQDPHATQRYNAARELGRHDFVWSDRRGSMAFIGITPEGRGHATGLVFTYEPQEQMRSILHAIAAQRSVPDVPGGSAQEVELHDAMTYLLAEGLVRVDDDDALGEAYSNPRVTPLGRQCLASGLGPEDFIHHSPRGGVVNNNIDNRTQVGSVHSRDSAQVVVGHNVTVTNGAQAAQLAAIDAFLTELRETPPAPGAEAEHDALGTAAAEIREQVASGALEGAKEATKELIANATRTAFRLVPSAYAIGQALGLN